MPSRRCLSCSGHRSTRSGHAGESPLDASMDEPASGSGPARARPAQRRNSEASGPEAAENTADCPSRRASCDGRRSATVWARKHPLARSYRGWWLVAGGWWLVAGGNYATMRRIPEVLMRALRLILVAAFAATVSLTAQAPQTKDRPKPAPLANAKAAQYKKDAAA